MAITGQWPYGHIVKNGHNRILHLAIMGKNIGVSYVYGLGKQNHEHVMKEIFKL